MGLSEARTEHLYVTYMMRSKASLHLIDLSKLARLYRTCPFLLGNAATGRRGVIPEFDTVFSRERSHLRLQEDFWHYQMESSTGRTLKARLKLFASLFVLMNVWACYKRVAFYMEHSFDLVNPDIDYLVHRF